MEIIEKRKTMKRYEVKFRSISDALKTLDKIFSVAVPPVDDFILHWVDCSLGVPEDKVGEFQNFITHMFNSEMYGILSCVEMNMLEG